MSALFLLKDEMTHVVPVVFPFKTFTFHLHKGLVGYQLCSKLSIMEYSVQNTHMAQAQAMAEEKGAKQLVISNWDIKEVLEFLKMKV